MTALRREDTEVNRKKLRLVDMASLQEKTHFPDDCVSEGRAFPLFACQDIVDIQKMALDCLRERSGHQRRKEGQAEGMLEEAAQMLEGIPKRYLSIFIWPKPGPEEMGQQMGPLTPHHFLQEDQTGLCHL